VVNSREVGKSEAAGHVSRQMLERYSHIRTQAKQAAIQALEEPVGEPLLRQAGHKSGHSDANTGAKKNANLLEENGGPTRIRTWDQRIMSAFQPVTAD